MRPRIEDAWFGSITVEGVRYEHDILIRLSGKVRRRNKQLSKALYGTSHIIDARQFGDGNDITVNQVGPFSGQLTTSVVTGDDNTITVDQDNNGVGAGAATWNEARLVTTGDGNGIDIDQLGRDNITLVDQIGNLNGVSVDQTGIGHSTDIDQTGNSNNATVTQN